MLNFNFFLIKRILIALVFLPMDSKVSSIEPSDCRSRLRYTSFDKMTKNERITWLFCAYEKLKEGDDRHLRVYKEKNGNVPNYNQFLKLWENRSLDK